MPSSNRGMFGRGNGTITVIEQPVMRSYRRKAKIVFYVTWFITAVLAATVAASKWHPVIALFAGLALGFITRRASPGPSWPPGRSSAPSGGGHPKPSSAGSLIFGWIELAEHTTLFYRLAAHRRHHRRPGRLQAGPRPASTRPSGAWSPGTASGPASRSSSSPTAPAACR